MLSWPRALWTMMVVPWESQRRRHDGLGTTHLFNVWIAQVDDGAGLETRRAGILVLPFLGYSLRIVVPPLLLLLLDVASEEREWLRRLRWLRARVVWVSRLPLRWRCSLMTSRSRMRSGYERYSSSP